MPSKTEIIGLGIVWDEISGPDIVSYSPKGSLNDPQGVAMQIYMSAAAVFGQQKIEEVQFTLPLLSWSPDGIVRVMFGNWIDEEVRGGERPCYVAFITTTEIENLLYKDLGTVLQKAISKIKEQREDFEISPYVADLQEKLGALRDSQEDNIKEFKEKTSLTEYSIVAAQRDLAEAASMWEDRNDNALRLSLRAGERLEGIDSEAAGNAYFLTGTIFFQQTNYTEAIKYFEKAAQEYNVAKMIKDAAEASFNAAICYYRLGDYNKAKEDLFLSAPILSDQGDEHKKARLYLYLGLSLDELKSFEEAGHYFQLAIESAKKSSDYEFAGQICNIFASKLTNRKQLELAAKYRENAAKNFLHQKMFQEAGTAFSIASRVYRDISNFKKSMSCLIEANKSFKVDGDYLAAGKALLKINSLAVPSNAQYFYQSLDNFSKVSENSIREYWMGITHQELGTHYEETRNFIKAIENFEKAQDLLEGTETIEYVSLLLKMANLYFKLENYSKAAQWFESALKTMIQFNIGQSNQQEKCKINAIKSYKKAILDHLAVFNFFLFSQEYKDAIKHLRLIFEESNHIVDLYSDTLPQEEKDWFKKLLQKLSFKKTLFGQELQKNEFKSILLSSRINRYI